MSVIDTTTGQELNLNHVYKFLTDLVFKTGNVIRDAFYKEKTLKDKQSFADLVTETDTKVERIIFDALKAKYPTHSFIGEESTNSKIQLSDNPTWILDPVDGTTNFVHTFPFCAISIAFYVNKQAQIGVVYNPIRDECFSAITGQGAYLNGKAISSSGCKELNKAQVLAEFGSDRDQAKIDLKVQSMRNLIGKIHSIRCLGSAALNMCFVACGRADAYFECGMHIWDIAAGSLIGREAGCVVSDLDGSELNLVNRRILIASSAELAREVGQLVTPVPYESD